MLDRGCEHDMEKLDIYCSLCEWYGVFKNYQVLLIRFSRIGFLKFVSFQEHLKNSHSNPTCKYCSQQFDSPNSLIQHTSICGMIPIDCVFKPIGCIQQVNESYMQNIRSV